MSAGSIGSVKQLDFSKHNLVIDLAEVKRMFGMHFNEGCRYLVKQAFEKIMALDTCAQVCMSIFVLVAMSGRLYGVGFGMGIGSVIY